MQSYAPAPNLSRLRAKRGHPQGGVSPRVHPITVSLSFDEITAVRARAAQLGKKPAIYLYELVTADLARGEG